MVTLAERISGALLGHAAGDCLGAPVEFLTPDRIAATIGAVTEIVGGGVLGWRRGEGTDDTDQNLAVVDSYVAIHPPARGLGIAAGPGTSAPPLHGPFDASPPMRTPSTSPVATTRRSPTDH